MQPKAACGFADRNRFFREAYMSDLRLYYRSLNRYQYYCVGLRVPCFQYTIKEPNHATCWGLYVLPAVCLMSGLKNASLTARGCDLQCAAVFFHGLEKVAEAKTRLLSLAYADTLLYSLYSTVVLYTILYYTIRYYTILYSTALCSTILYYAMLSYHSRLLEQILDPSR